MSMLVLTAIISFAASLAAKLLVDHFLVSRFAILGSFFGFEPATNSGVAFSITFPGHLQSAFIAIAVIALALVARHAKTVLSQIAFGLILGGALANIADRIFDGSVTDFVQVGTFPIFNIADSCISIGVALLVIEAVMQWF